MVNKRETAKKEEVFLFFDDALADCIREFVLENEKVLIEKFHRAIKEQAETCKMILVTNNDKKLIRNWLEKNQLYRFIKYIL